MKRIAIINTVALNGGDAAILIAIDSLLARRFGDGYQLLAYDNHPEVAARYYPEFEFRKQFSLRVFDQQYIPRNRLARAVAHRLHRPVQENRIRLGVAALRRSRNGLSKLFLRPHEIQDLKAFSEADLVISTGGTYLVENYRLADRIFDFQVVLQLGRPLVLFTQSLGPFRDPGNRRAFSDIFQRASQILLRDEASLKHVADLGIDLRNVRMSADVVFALADEAVLESARTRSLPGSGTPLRVGISVREWPYFKRIHADAGMRQYVSSVRSAVEYLIQAHQAEITFLSTCQGIPEYRWDDSRVAKEVVRGLSPDIRARCTVEDGFLRPQHLMDRLGGLDLVIATRMHMAILSLVSGTPVLPIAYEFKTSELFARLGLGQYVHDIETVTGPSLVASLGKFLNALAEIRSDLFHRVDLERKRALESASVLSEVAAGAAASGRERVVASQIHEQYDG